MKKLIALFAIVGASLSLTASAASLGSLKEVIGVGNSLSIGLNTSPTGQWYLVSGNSVIVQSSISQNKLIVRGLSTGSALVTVCTEPQGTNCLSVSVTVSGVLGSYVSNIHPVGTWVISGKTVFYVHLDGLIP